MNNNEGGVRMDCGFRIGKRIRKNNNDERICTVGARRQEGIPEKRTIMNSLSHKIVVRNPAALPRILTTKEPQFLLGQNKRTPRHDLLN